MKQSNEMKTIKNMARHLVALDYANEKVEALIARLPKEATPNDIMKVLNWYYGQVKYHQEKALSQMPDDIREAIDSTILKREMENTSASLIFLRQHKGGE